MAKEGDAFITFHADADPDRVAAEAERGILGAAEIVEDDLKKTGKDWGDTLSESAAKEIEKQGPELSRAVEKGIGKRKVRVKTNVETDVDNDSVEKLVENFSRDVEQAFTRANRPGGPFSRIGAGIADAIGAGFNISGKSPLIAFLVPLVGAIIGLVVAAVQAAGALVAVIATVPALIAGIGIQVGALMFAFHGLGDAIKNAFAAKNAKELKEALKDLSPPAQQFVRDLLPLRDLFRFIAKRSQLEFFTNLGRVLPQLQQTLGRALGEGFPKLAAALGGLFRDLALFFASPAFVSFVNKLFPATIEFLAFFGPSFIKFLNGLIQMSTTILPFLNTLGRMLGGTLFQLGDFFERISRNGSLQKWLDSMTITLQLVLELFGGLIEFVTVLLAQLDEAGGAAVIQTLIDAFEILSFFLSTDLGKKALEGLIDFSIIAIKVTTGLILAIFLVLAAFEALAEWIKNTAIPAIGEFLSWLGGRIVWLATVIGTALEWVFRKLGSILGESLSSITTFFLAVWHGITGNVGNIVKTVRELPGKITAALGDLGQLLFNAGRHVIEGLINGIKSKFGPLASVVDFAAQIIRDHWPFSPAKTGPLSGKGDPMLAGQRTMDRFAEGIRMEIPEIRSASSEATSNIVFGRDAIRVSFEGALPTQEQAERTGSAVGAGINGQLAARNTRLAVRTL